MKRIKKVRKRLYGLGAMGSLLLWTISSGWAYSIKPGAQILRAKPGKTIKAVFEVVNTDPKAPMDVVVKARDSFTLPENKDYPVTTWLELSDKRVHVPAGASRKIVGKVHVPLKASGELAALVSFTPETPEADAKAQAAAAKQPKDHKPGVIETRIVTMITVSLYVRVEGTEKGEADLGDVRVVNKPAVSDQPAAIEANVTVKNSGNVHQRPGGLFDIYKKGETTSLHHMEFKSGWPVLPHNDGLYTAITAGTLPSGDYEMTTKVTFVPTDISITKKTQFTVDLAGNTTNYHDIP